MVKSRVRRSILLAGSSVLVLLAASVALALIAYSGSGDDADAADAAAALARTNLAQCRVKGMEAFPEGAKSQSLSAPDHTAYENYVVSCMEGRRYRYGGKWCFGQAPLNNINCYEGPPAAPSEFRRWVSHLFHPAGPPVCGAPKTGVDRDLCDFAIEQAIGHWITNETELRKSRKENWDYVPADKARRWTQLSKAERCDFATAEVFAMAGGTLTSAECNRLTGDYVTPWQPIQPTTKGPGISFADFQRRGCKFAHMLDVSKELDLPTIADKQAYYVSLWITTGGRPWHNNDSLLPDRDLMLTSCAPVGLTGQPPSVARGSWREP